MKSQTVAIGEFDYTLSVHRDVSEGADIRAPILVYVNHGVSTAIGCYVYTVGAGANTYSTVLLGVDNGDLHDMAANLGRVLVKKFNRPSYVCMSGAISMYDYPLVSRKVVEQCM